MRARGVCAEPRARERALGHVRLCLCLCPFLCVYVCARVVCCVRVRVRVRIDACALRLRACKGACARAAVCARANAQACARVLHMTGPPREEHPSAHETRSGAPRGRRSRSPPAPPQAGGHAAASTVTALKEATVDSL